VDEVRITSAENGPYEVTGSVELRAPDGTAISPPGARLLLCRCGRSEDKPFCDSPTEGTPPTCARQKPAS
jgi:CDGSH-type Zn-finger protein